MNKVSCDLRTHALTYEHMLKCTMCNRAVDAVETPWEKTMWQYSYCEVIIIEISKIKVRLRIYISFRLP